jgi:hypothetical protein
MLASNLMESVFDGFFKIAISMLMLPIGFKAAQFDKNTMIKGVYWMVIILLINYVFSQFFKLGVSVYSEDSFYKGGATASAPIILSMSILIFFSAFNSNQLPYSKLFTILLSSITIFIIILSVKRGAIFGLAAGFAVYFVFTSKKINSSFRLLLIAVGFIAIFSEYSDVIQKRVDARSTEKNEIQNENRYREVFYMLEEMEKLSIPQILFGYEPFNSSKIMAKYFGRPRQLHVDYTILLFGTGIFGLLIYLGLFLNIFGFAQKLKLIFSQNRFIRGQLQVFEYFALLSGLIALSLTMSFSGGLQFLSYRIILFLFIGYSLGKIYFWKSLNMN